MSVLVVPSWYKNKRNNNLGSFFYEQFLALKKKKIDIIVANATLQGRKNYFDFKNFEINDYNDNGLRTVCYTCPSLGIQRIPKLACFIFYLNLKKVYKYLIKDNVKIDCIHAHSFYPGGAAATKLGKKYNIPVIITEHCSILLTDSLKKSQINILKYTVEGSRRFICVSDTLKNKVIAYTNTKKDITVIPNLVNYRFQFLKNKKNEKFTFVSIGNLIPIKRFDLTIKAFKQVLENDNNVKLIIIGDGYLKEKLIEYVKKNEMENNVLFTGRLSREKVVSFLLESDAFVLPSDFETFGVAYIEALACGLPVIAAKNGGAEEIINESNGFIIQKNDLQQLINKMNEMKNKFEHFDLKQISKNAIEKYGEDSVCKQIIKVYDDIITRKGR